MSLRLRLALILAAVFVGLAALGEFGLHRLADGLKLAMAESASEAGQRVLRVLNERVEQVRSKAEGGDLETELRVFVNGRELDAEEASRHAAMREGSASSALLIHRDPHTPGTRLEVRALALAGR